MESLESYINRDKLLMVFVRNPELGKVKTRLAKSIGAARALVVYKNLLMHTNKIANRVNAQKAVFYSNFIDDCDLWNNDKFQKYLQKGDSLGEKMQNAFRMAFAKGFKKVLIIGSDCYELGSHTIEDAFHELKEKDAVMGPAEDGGYYLLGLNRYIPDLFMDKEWGGENVMLDTILDLDNLRLSYSFLELLNDVDLEADLGELKKFIE